MPGFSYLEGHVTVLFLLVVVGKGTQEVTKIVCFLNLDQTHMGYHAGQNWHFYSINKHRGKSLFKPTDGNTGSCLGKPCVT